MDIFSKNKLVAAAAALIIAGAVWYGFSGGSPPALLGTENANGVVNSEDQDLVATLLKLRSVTLTGTIFQSQVFLGLKDFSTEITQEPVGRVDPFAPIPVGVSQSAAVSGANNTGGAGLFNKPQP
ncbi:MAG: hypothetical protein Q7S08_03700 [bacterium]|nr:hypothetical protein [bacterium]